MPALRQAAGSVHDDCCKLGQLTKQVRRCQRGVTAIARDLSCGGRQSSATAVIMIGYGFPALVELLTARLNVVPLSSRRLPPVRLSVDPPCAEPLPD